jgi:hypothetical protein
MNIALIAEYLGCACNLDARKSTSADYAKANGLALRCLAELPSPIWQRVFGALKLNRWEGALLLIADLWAEELPDDPISPDFWVFHGPNIGNPKSQ